MMPASSIPGFYSRSLDGHRSAYLDFVLTNFGGQRIKAKEIFFWKGPVLFLMIEENFALYVLTSIFRWLQGRRTVGLLFRPSPTIEAKSWRLRIKRSILKVCRQISQIKTLSIVPTPLDPRIDSIADGWIHDFQLWDLTPTTHIRIMQMQMQMQTQRESTNIDKDALKFLKLAHDYSKKRRLLVAIGTQNKSKGIDKLAAATKSLIQANWGVLVAGSFTKESASSKELIESCGGLVIDRFLSDIEIEAAYAVADLVWCLYDPTYDQASGIFGRAIQLGIPTIVRTESFSHKFCKNIGFPCIDAENSDDIASNSYNAIAPKINTQELTKQLANENANRIRIALGLQAENIK